MSSKSPVRSCEDVDEVSLSYAEIKALCAGNPLIAEKMNLDNDVARLQLIKSDYQSQRYRLEDNLLQRFPQQIAAVTERIAGLEKDISVYGVHKEKTVDLQPSLTGGAVTASAKFPGMTINGVKYTEKEPAAKALLEACKGLKDKEELPIGKYMGFAMNLQIHGMMDNVKVLLRGTITHQTELGDDTFGNITRINNLLADLPKRLENAKSQLDDLNAQQEAVRQELEKPFTLEDELSEKEARLALLNAELNIDGSGDDEISDADERDSGSKPAGKNVGRSDPGSAGIVIVGRTPQTTPAKSGKPLLDGIRNFDGGKYQGAPSRDISTQHAI